MTIDPTAARLAGAGVAYAPEIASAARRHGLDPTLLAAVAAQETGGPGANAGRNVVGDGGHGHGLFQIDDRWHAFAKTAAAMDPAKNADYAAGMLSGLLDQYGGNLRSALSAYNSGSAGGAPAYAQSVLEHYSEIAGGAVAELPSLVNSLGALASQAQSLPNMPSTPMQQQPQTYHRQATDYSGLFDDTPDA